MKTFFYFSTALFFFLSPLAAFSQSSSLIALVETRKDGWHYINENGDMLFKAQDEAYQFSEGLLMRFQKRKWGFVDCLGNWVIQPSFDAVKDFVNGYARIKIGFSWGMINREGKVITKEVFDDIYDFSEGMARVKLEGLWGYIDTAGSVIIQPQYREAFEFNDGKATVRKGEDWFLIDKKGEVAVVPEVEGVTYMGGYSNGRIRVRTGSGTGKLISWGFIDSSGFKVISSRYRNAEDFSEGLARVREDNKWGYIDKDGKYVILPLFEDAEDFNNGHARVMMEGKWGIVDLQGKWVCQPEFDVLWDVVNGYVGARKKGDWGIITINGEWAIPPNFKYVKSLKMVSCPE